MWYIWDKVDKKPASEEEDIYKKYEQLEEASDKE